MRKPALLLSLVLIGALLSACGGDGEPEAGSVRDDEAEVTVRSTTVERILAEPEVWDQVSVTVRGRAYPRERGFLLVDSGASIWVAAPDGVDAIERGERVAIRGEVQRLTQDDADAVVEALRGPVDPPLQPPESDAIEQTPAQIGEPFIAFRALVRNGDRRRGDQPAAAGEDGERAGDDDTEIYEIADLQDRLEAAGLMLVRTGGGSDIEDEIDEPTRAARRYEISPSSREFELLIFPSRAALKRAVKDLRDPELLLDQEYEIVTAANVLAAFPPPTGEFRGYRIVRRVLAELE